MKQLKDIITEKLRLDKNLKHTYICQPKDWIELRSIIENRLAKDNDANLNDIDVSKIKDMSLLFKDLDPHNIRIDRWNVSNVKDMSHMFFKCKKFNCDLSKWDVSNVKDISYMFLDCDNFNCDLNSWDISKVEYIYCVFLGCKSLKNIPDWYKA